MSDKQLDKIAFKQKLGQYKTAIDADIAVYAAHVRKSTLKQYGEYSSAVTEAYLNMLERGGKRIRGALVMAGYEMSGGKDREMIVRAATAIEMLHAYILIIDDIQDRSKMRRNFPTVHEALADFHRKNHLRGDAAHTGISLALNSALSGGHAAQTILAGLSVDAELRLKVIGIVNHTMVTTAHGQTADIMNELVENIANNDVERALEWKTAHYTILNPLCVGMVLAGAGCEETDAIRDYALHTGKAFQITDDIMGVFGTDEQTGKSVMDDIREGKRTLISLYAIEHAAGADRTLLLSCLGNDALTREEFEQCQQIIIRTGALGDSQKLAAKHAQLALEALDRNEGRWRAEEMAFLRSLVLGLLNRTA